MKLFGYDVEKCQENIEDNKPCSETGIYYMFLKRYIKDGGTSACSVDSPTFNADELEEI